MGEVISIILAISLFFSFANKELKLENEQKEVKVVSINEVKKEEIKVEDTKKPEIKIENVKTENIINEVIKNDEKQTLNENINLNINDVTDFIFKKNNGLTKEETKIKELESIYKKARKRQNLDFRILLRISKKESNFNNLVININRNKKYKELIGSHKFKNIEERVKYVEETELKKLNYDAGISQINGNWKTYYKLTSRDLFNIEKNVNTSARILRKNLDKYCNQDLTCRLSVYNSGYKKSEIGLKYARDVIKNYNNIKKLY